MIEQNKECGILEVLPSTFGTFYTLRTKSGAFGVVDNDPKFASPALSAAIPNKSYCFDVAQRYDFGEGAKGIEISGYQEQVVPAAPSAEEKCGEWEALLTGFGWNYNLRLSETEVYMLTDDVAPKVDGGFSSLNGFNGRVCVQYSSISHRNMLEVSKVIKCSDQHRERCY